MPAMKKADLIGAMEALGETPPKSWTVTEIECRLQELRKEKGIPEMAQRKNKTPLRQMMVDLNTAGRKKENLIKHMQEVLHVPLTGTETIKVMMAKGVQAVYDQAEASPQDPVGFGKHSSLSYEEVYQKHVTYCTWVTTTAGEDNDCCPRLVRLANWLEGRQLLDQSLRNQGLATHARAAASSEPPQGYKPTTSGPMTGILDTSSISEGKKPESDPETKELLQMLAHSVITLKEEVQDLKMERPRKEAKAKSQAAPSDAGSFELMPQ